MMDIKSPVGEARNEYTYSASGQKLKVIQKLNPAFNTNPTIGSAINVSSLTTSLTTDYVGNKIYENGNLKRVLVDGGYIDGGKYHYYLTDHLGNNRAVVEASGAIIQQTQYYPFGMAFAENVGMEKQPYKYNNKELDTKHGLNMYDYSARYLDNGVPRFSSVDPLAEKYYSWSPYVYVMNNPMRFIDLDGRTLKIAGNAKTIIEDVARVAATFRGSGVVNSLILSDNLYEINTVFFQKSSEFTMAPNFRDGLKYPIKYANNPWVTGENDIMYDGWEILGHEMQHANDFEDGLIRFASSLNDSELSFAEGRAVSFGNYLRDSYGMNYFRNSYAGKTWNGDESFRQFRVGNSENVSNFKSLGGNKAGNSFGFSYNRANKNKYMVISYNKDRKLSINFYDDEDEYDEATEDW